MAECNILEELAGERCCHSQGMVFQKSTVSMSYIFFHIKYCNYHVPTPLANKMNTYLITGVPRSEANREQKMKEIVTRRKLVEKIKSQDAEYADLKMEIERLYMKTFPALVQMN